MSYDVTIQEGMGYIRHQGRYEKTYTPMVFLIDDIGKEPPVAVYEASTTFDLEIAKHHAQELRDLYQTPGSNADHYEVAQVGLSAFLRIVRSDGSFYIPSSFMIGVDLTNTGNVCRFEAMLDRIGLIKVRENHSWEAQTICGRYERRDHE